MIDRLQLVRNVGQFESMPDGSIIRLAKVTLVYAENGRGKTTFAAILRSLASGDPTPVLERKRLAASGEPHIVLALAGAGGVAVFQNGNWSQTLPEISVFDDRFVTENVCAGLDVGADHRQNLHELILGAQGVSLNRALRGYASRIDEHNTALRATAAAIPVGAIPSGVRGELWVDEFCALEPHPDIEVALEDAERTLAAAKDADAVLNEPPFDPINLPAFNTETILERLQSDLPGLDQAASARVQAHLMSVGPGGEAWIAEGMHRLSQAKSDGARSDCPFCAQGLDGSQLVAHYRAYFSTAYSELKRAIVESLRDLQTLHGGDVMASFERAVRVAVQRRQFWAQFTDVPEMTIDTAAITRAWKDARDEVSAVLEIKRANPLERLTLSTTAQTAIAIYESVRSTVSDLSGRLSAVNSAIGIVKEKASAANVAALVGDLAMLQATRARYRIDVAPLCDEYLAEKADKAKTEGLRTAARAALDRYRQSVFPAYEHAINGYLQRFNAGFRLARVNPVNTRTGSACTYNVLINNVSVPLVASTTPGPSFRNTLSSGDRNALALAFFFASLERDPDYGKKIVAIDDPMTSLDEHRTLTTIQEMHRLTAAVGQVIILSHSKPFLCALWEGADKVDRAAFKIGRIGASSTIETWDVNQDAITEHDRRFALVRSFMNRGNAADERAVAVALRYIIEAFVRVAYPDVFPPGTLLGPFLASCQQKVGTPNQILSGADVSELRAILDYANKYHHDTNSAWETTRINDAELQHFCHRVVSFTQRR